MNRDKMIASLSGLRFFTLGAFVAALGGVGSAVHAQDECSNAQVLQVGTPISFTFTATSATPSANPPADTQCADGTFVWTAATPDLWYRFVAPSTGLATFDTCYPDPFNSADTSIALYAGDCGSLVQVACSGDYFGNNSTPTGCSFTSSRVASFEVIAGQTYLLRIGSVANAQITTETRPGNISVRMSKVAAWGLGNLGQIDAPSNVGTVSKLSAGARHTLALRTDGAVIAWGDNASNQINVPTGLGTVIAVAAGNNHSLALRSNGTIAGWGSDLNLRASGGNALTGVVSIAAGGSHSLAALSTGAVVGFGVNTAGQTTIPAGLTGVVEVAAGNTFSVARRSNGAVAAWGSNTFGQRNVPAGLVATKVSVNAIGNHALALRGDGTVAAWGQTTLGQTAVPADLANVIDIAAGGAHSLALLANGSIVSWGSNQEYQRNLPGGSARLAGLSGGSTFTVAIYDECPSDPLKTNPGICGCGSPDIDSDGDGVYECNDLCPTNPALTEPVAYFADVDLDGFGDPSSTISVCETSAPAGYVSDTTDCDDTKLLYADGDQDGFGAGAAVACGSPFSTDCDDSAAGVNPNAVELCSNLGVDNDCDTINTEAEATDRLTFYQDGDNDGFAGSTTGLFCSMPTGYEVADEGDCADSDAAVFPGAVELCANLGVDNDCDTVNTEEEATDRLTFYQDGDSDGFAGSTAGLFCSMPAGYEIADEGDCVDSDAAIFPGAVELCADLGVDNDCDTVNTEEEATDRLTFYADTDGDLAGDASVTALACSAPTGYVAVAGDNCPANGQLLNARTYYADADQDGFGLLSSTTSVCETTAPAGFVVDSSDCDDARVEYTDGDNDGFGAGAPVACNGVLTNTDCDDASNLAFPGAPELCADLAVDNDCDGSTAEEEATDRVTFYGDSDNDGAGDASVNTLACSAPTGYVAVAGDNCPANGQLLNARTYYADADQDGFGLLSSTTSVCETTAPAGFIVDSSDCDDARVEYTDGDNDGFGAGAPVACNGVLTNTDCDDASNLAFPGAPELCADLAVDNDCDGSTAEEEATDRVSFYRDIDLDGFGDPNTTALACSARAGFVTNSTDNCDGNAALVDPVTYYADADEDGFGALASSTSVCETTAPDGFVANSSDCDDAAVIYADGDQDGFGAGAPVACNGVASNTDCDDTTGDIKPGALENCANIAVDNDCDGVVTDAEATDSVAYFVDADQDGFGAGTGTLSCSAIAGSVTDSSDCDDAAVTYADGDQDGFGAGAPVACNGVASNTDCDDTTGDVKPGALENCANIAVDNDCDGVMTDAEATDSVAYYLDGDQDGFGAGSATMSCSAIAGSVTDNTDCDDTTGDIKPGALENCANIAVDNDCDGVVTDAEATDSVAYFVDADQDGFGAGTGTLSCSAIAGSVTDSSDCDDAAVTYADGDADGFGAGAPVACNGVLSNTDCDDTTGDIKPGALENCANIAVDNDCDGVMTDAEATDSVAYYLDADQDGFGSSSPTMSCSPIAGSVTDNTDCDDTTGDIKPGALENCANIAVDNDCDGVVTDAEATDSVAYFVDADQDGFGAGTGTLSCSAIAGSVTDSSDCDDAAVTYADTDADGFGSTVRVACNGVASSTDCDDTTGDIKPGAVELCATASVDNNCDGTATDVDANAADKVNFYTDVDGDGHSVNVTAKFCTGTTNAGYIATLSSPVDCNDAVAAINPAATEICDAGNVDENCNSLADNIDPTASAASKFDFFADVDRDGHSVAEASRFCDMPVGYLAQASNPADCDDLLSSVYPGAAELCSTASVDNNCDGTATDVDANAADKVDFFADGDGDLFTLATAERFCSIQPGYLAQASAQADCDDASDAAYPGAVELCATDSVDNNCDGTATDVDANAADKVDFFADGDGDLFTLATAERFCSIQPGYLAQASAQADCDDASDAAYPGAVELCATDSVDNNCDGTATDVDANAADKVDFFADGDGDLFTLATAERFCSIQPGYLAQASAQADCDDASDATYPGAVELCATDSVDNNCDGTATDVDANAADKVDFFADVDGDGHSVNVTAKFCTGTTNAGYIASLSSPADCNDSIAAINPAATEVCDAGDVDENCNGQADDADAGAALASKTGYFADLDNDAYTVFAPALFCDMPTGYRAAASDREDCDDAVASVYPGAVENCANDGVDNDCDGEAAADAEAIDVLMYCIDTDGDGYGAGDMVPSCTVLVGFVNNGTDCDNLNPLAYPGAVENCANDGVDNNCNGVSNAAEAVDSVGYFVDADGDGFGLQNSTATPSCVPVQGFVANATDCNDGQVEYTDGDGDGYGAGAPVACNGVLTSTDCNDGDALVSPVGIELCSNRSVDNDCDGQMLEEEATDRLTFYRDADNDGAGDAADTTLACTAPAGYVATATDLCVSNPSLQSPVTYYRDVDADGFGDLASTTSVCETTAPTGYVANSIDCNDGQVEYADIDGDGYGAGAAIACGGVAQNGDCHDGDYLISPAGIELCSNLSVDNDCDGSKLESEATDRTTFYGDADNDGAGDAAVTSLNCSAPAGFVSNANDLCPADGLLTAPLTWYADSDNDGAGDASVTETACAQPAGFVSVAGDGCPADAAKTAPGACGCGVADSDSDGDGALDCTDGCPSDPNKTAPGTCGCGVADVDDDGDGILSCVDNCPTTPNADQANCDTDTNGNACDSDDDNDGALDQNDAFICDAAKSDLDATFSAEQLVAFLGTATAATVDGTGMTFAQLVAVADNTANIAAQGIGGSFTLDASFSQARLAAILAKAKPATAFVGGANISINAQGMTSGQLGAVATGIAGVAAIENLSLDASFSSATITALVSKTLAGEAAINATGMTSAQLAASVSGASAVVLSGTITIDAGLSSDQIAEIVGSSTVGSTVNVDSTGMSAAQVAALYSTASLIVDSDAATTTGDLFTVYIDISNMPVRAVGLQACIEFNTSVLEWVAPEDGNVGGVDFPQTIFAQLMRPNAVAFGTGVDLGGDGTGVFNGNVARLTFRATAPLCGATNLVWIAPTGFTNRISSQAAAGGASSPIPFSIVNLANVSNFNTTVFAGVPANESMPAQAGVLGAAIAAPTVTASNSCGQLPVTLTVQYPVASGLANGSVWPAVFPVGATTLTWSTVDPLGNTVSEVRTVEVFDYQLATIDVNLIGGISPALSYTLPIRVRLSSGDVIATSVAYNGNNGQVRDIQVPVRSDYTCITAKDAGHTLATSRQMSVVGTKYAPATFTLTAGDSNDDNLVDVLDFGAFVSDRGVGKNPLSRSNFDRNPVVNNGDFAFIALNFLRSGDACGGGFTGNNPLERVSVKELRRAGLGYMAEADINNDGWVDTRDIALAMQGVYRSDAPARLEAADEVEMPRW